MPGPLPAGDPAPRGGALPDAALAELAERASLGWYFHVPFCRSRCGYCDFTTYTSAELGGGATAAAWADTAIAEIRLARRVLEGIDAPAPTVFFGGGTPSLLPGADVARVLGALCEVFGCSPGVEVTVEANPDDITPALVDAWAQGGVTRVSMGMQSAVPHTLQVLERRHDVGQVAGAALAVRQAGMQLSVDLIYGTPGESAQQWQDSLDAALALQPNHVSAYCLGIEPGTRLGAALRAGRIAPVDPDEAADRYEQADEFLASHGMAWYEISNWSLPGGECRHNLGYWRGDGWWGAGPAAHSHIAGVRWWNVRHPREWTAALARGESPAAAREVLSPQQRHEEDVLLRIRLAEPVPDALIPGGSATVQSWIAAAAAERLPGVPNAFRLTRRGRLVADALALQALTDPAAQRLAPAAPSPYTGTLGD